MMDRESLTAAVLAGGMSSRLGRDKALLELGGQTLLARAIATLHGIASEVLVIGPLERQPYAAGARVVPDAYPSTGPLGGIATALVAAAASRVLVVACDMPFLHVGLLAYLRDLDPAADATVPRTNGKTEQMHAIYGKSCLPVIQEQLAAGHYRVGRVLERVAVRYVDEPELRAIDADLRSFVNINTPAELAAAERLLETHQRFS